jgi:hypothetical protein
MLILVEVFKLGVLAQVTAHPTRQQWTTIENYAAAQYFDYGASGSIILNGTCKAESSGYNISIERISPPSTDSFKKIDDALSALTLLNQHLSWTRKSNGLVQLKDDRVTAPVLSLILRKVEIRSKVDPELAVEALMRNPEVVSFLKKNGIRLGIAYTGNLSHQNWRRTPSISKELENVSVEEVLDQIVIMQHGMWIYDACSTESGEKITIGFAMVR